ncbi:hypothetical protein Q765_01210 [Flavobacterium rivuli WB 3.3-2 = DSM 21788]|uniref:Uncharacterized protein n=2 Tax=Flavobacterium rivuli TaxID=498301 RepID=A0A0A2MJQ6_9FLAO|nr:hypothetical protein Q765_01210 [Flavobacterium rivuli WB 3.3-2 = DSM 21788]
MGCVLVASSIALILFPEKFTHRYSETVPFAIGIVGTLFFGACTIAALRIVIFKKIALSIDNNTLTINPGKKNTTALRWNEISGFKEVTVASQKFISVLLYNPEKNIEAETNSITKRLLIYNLKHYNSPYCFSANAYETNHNMLLNMLNEAWMLNTHKTIL